MSHIPGCFGNLVAMATRVKPLTFCLSHIEFIFRLEIPGGNRLSHTHRCYGSLVAMATTVKPQ